MSFLNDNCCLKLNYLICGSKNFSSKKNNKRFKFRQKPNVNGVRSNNKMVNQNELSTSINFSNQHNINVTSLQQNSPRKTFKCDKNDRPIKNFGYSSSLNCSINHSRSTLNNEIIIKDVILHRKNLNERLGLTLCYGITSESTTNIYIEQVDKNSIADCQGKLQRGDQIIQINNHRVTNRDQAIQLVHGTSTIILQIVRFQFPKTNLSPVASTITEDDSGVILACNTDFETNNQSIHQKCLNENNSIRKMSSSLSCLLSNHYSTCHENHFYFSQIEYRRCLSLNDLTNYSFINEQINSSKSSIKDLIHSQSLFEITTDNEKFILKPLPFNDNLNDSGLVFGQYQNNHSHSKQIRRRYREECLKELITTDDEIMSEFKQGRYWTKEQRKKQFQRSKQYKQKNRIFQQNSNSIHSTTEDFNLLNRIFLRENQKELKQKPYLAVKYEQQSTIEREKLKKIIEKYPIHHHFKSQSNTTMSINSTQYYPPTIII